MIGTKCLLSTHILRYNNVTFLVTLKGGFIILYLPFIIALPVSELIIKY